MATQTLKDKNFSIIGYIETANDGKQTIKDKHFSIKGYYDPKTNTTKNSRFQIIGQGNLLTTLL